MKEFLFFYFSRDCRALKDLASTTHEVTDFLFGDNLAKQVKDLNLANKLSINRHNYVYKQKSEKQNYRTKPYYHSQEFFFRERPKKACKK